jgi:hypothetical protein
MWDQNVEPQEEELNVDCCLHIAACEPFAAVASRWDLELVLVLPQVPTSLTRASQKNSGMAGTTCH